MVFFYQNCSDLLWEKNVLVIKNKFFSQSVRTILVTKYHFQYLSWFPYKTRLKKNDFECILYSLDKCRPYLLIFFPWATDIYKFSMFIQGPIFIIFAKSSKPYVYSFCQNFQALCLFSTLFLFWTVHFENMILF